MCLQNIGMKVGKEHKMKIIDFFKNQPMSMQILDIVFIICILYEFTLMIFNIQINMPMSLLMLFIIFVNTIRGLKTS